MFAHEDTEEVIGCDSVFYVYSKQTPSLFIHGGLPELFRIHLTQTFVALDGQTFFCFFHQQLEELGRILELFLTLTCLYLAVTTLESGEASELFAQLGKITRPQELVA